MPTYDNATTGETEVMMNSPPIRILTPRLVLRATPGTSQPQNFCHGVLTLRKRQPKNSSVRGAKPPGVRPAVSSGPLSTGVPTDRSASSSCSYRMTRRQRYITDWDLRSGTWLRRRGWLRGHAMGPRAINIIRSPHSVRSRPRRKLPRFGKDRPCQRSID